jgi:hypothetical protein
MNRIFFALLCILTVCSIFAFTVTNHVNKQDQKKPETKGLPHKWFKYRMGETGVPSPDDVTAKDATNYVLVGDAPYCGGTDSFCGIYAEPSNNTPAALPLITTTEENDIDNFFHNPTYSGVLIDRKIN